MQENNSEVDRCEAGVAPVSCKILAYLAEHPDAQDSLEGITHWWILEQKIKQRLAEVRAAVVELLEKKLIVERKAANGTSYYRINRRKFRLISSLLKKKTC